MSVLYNYFFGTYEIENPNKDDFIFVRQEHKFLISKDELKSVNLQPPKDVIPNPSRNMPPNWDKVDLRNLNKAQLNAVLSVKLKPIIPNKKITYYPPRNPVLHELHRKFNIGLKI